MLDNAQLFMAQGNSIAAERAEGVNDNMSKSHFHDFYELYYLESGERYHMINGDLYLMKSGEFVVFPPNTMHHSYSAEDISFRRIVIYFREELFHSEEISQCFNGKKILICGTLNSTDCISIHRLVEMIHEEFTQPQTCSEDYLASVLNLLLITIIRKSYFPDKVIEKNTITKVIQYLQEHYAEDITISHLSDIFYLSPYYLCREFKKNTGRTIIQYLNSTRITLAKRMFIETNKNITEISQATGFSNLTHFNRIFKSVTGQTPSAYKKNCRKKQ